MVFSHEGVKKSNNTMIQRVQNNVFQMIVGPPWQVWNDGIYRDLELETVTDEIMSFVV